MILQGVKAAQDAVPMAELEQVLSLGHQGTGAPLHVLQDALVMMEQRLVGVKEPESKNDWLRMSAVKRADLTSVTKNAMKAGATSGEMCVIKPDVFHGTKQSTLDSILKEGLRPDAEGFSWATSKLDDAKRFAYGANEEGLSGIILNIQAPASAYEKVLVGPKGEQFYRTRFKGHIKPEWIKGVYAKIEDGSWKLLAVRKPHHYLPLLLDADGRIIRPQGIAS